MMSGRSFYQLQQVRHACGYSNGRAHTCVHPAFDQIFSEIQQNVFKLTQAHYDPWCLFPPMSSNVPQLKRLANSLWGKSKYFARVKPESLFDRQEILRYLFLFPSNTSLAELQHFWSHYQVLQQSASTLSRVAVQSLINHVTMAALRRSIPQPCLNEDVKIIYDRVTMILNFSSMS